MEDNVCRIVKVDKEALFEFIYEEFIARHDHMLDIPATTTSLLSPGKKYKDYNFDELRDLVSENN